MLTRAIQACSVAVVLAAAPLLSFPKDILVAVRVVGTTVTDVPLVAKVLQARVDELRTGLFGSTSSQVDRDVVVVSTSGWTPDKSLAEAVVTSGRQLRLVVEPAADVLLVESDIADARPGIDARPELAIRLNEAGVAKLKARGSTLIGKVISVYWNGRLISRPRVGAELVRDIAISVPSERDAAAIAAVLRAGPLPGGAALTLAK